MAENEEKKVDRRKDDRDITDGDASHILSFAVICLFEYVFIKYIWFKPAQAIPLMMKIFLQLVVLLPAYTGFMERIKMGKKLKAEEISPAYAADLNHRLGSQLFIVYFAFATLLRYAIR